MKNIIYYTFFLLILSTANSLAPTSSTKTSYFDKIFKKVQGVTQEIFNAPHFNELWHREGGKDGTLRNHIELMFSVNIKKLPKILSTDSCEIVQNVLNKHRDDIDEAILFHDIGKCLPKHRLLKEDNVSWSFPEHAEGSYHIIIRDKITYKMKPLSESVIFAIRHHDYRFICFNKESTDSDYLNQVNKWMLEFNDSIEEFHLAMELLIVLSILDVLGSKSIIDRSDDFLAINKLTSIYRNFVNISCKSAAKINFQKFA